MRKPKYIISALAVIGAAVLLYFALTINNVRPGTPQAADIEGVINRFFFLIHEANVNGDCSVYREVLVDTQDYRPDEKTRQFVIQTLNKSSDFQPGYLSTMTADCMSYHQDPIRILAQQTQAPNSGSASYTPYQIALTSLTVRGNRATVTYETMASSDTATLIRVNGKWYISDMDAHAHF